MLFKSFLKCCCRPTILFGLNPRSHQIRNSSILRTIDSSPVLVSSNHDVYTNLALEQWLYSNLKFKNGANDPPKSTDEQSKLFKTPVVFIWTDEPCIVIGRHQNPWVEANLGFMKKLNIKLARRNSGGGCVYHDENNVNISIIGDRKLFEKRQENLKFLASVLESSYGIKCEPNKRHDLIHSGTGLKVSGSAAKLGRFNCYHHFTLLVESNKDALYTTIRQKQQDFMNTNSTISTRSKVINLADIKTDLNVEQVICDLANAYNKLYMDPKAIKPAERKDSIEGFEDDFSKLNKIREELQTWEWLYGKTPKFKLEKSFPLIDGGVEKQVRFVVQINKGLFESIDINCNNLLGGGGNSINSNFQYLIGTKFTYQDAMVNVAKLLQIDETNLSAADMTIGIEKLFATFLLQMIHESNF